MAPNIHLIVGDDDYLVESMARKIVDKAVKPELRGSAIETIDGAAGNMDDEMKSLRACEASVDTPPFLDPVKLTWWRNVTFLPQSKGKLSESVKEALETFAKKLAAHPLPENQVLLITAPRMLATSIFAKTCLKAGAETAVIPSEEKSYKRAQLALARVEELAAERGLKFAPGAAEAFVARVGGDTRTLVSELEKMKDYLGPKDALVTREAVADISSVGSEPELWELTDAVGRRDASKTSEVLARYAGEDGAGILLATVLERFFRELVLYRDAMDRGWLTNYGWSRALDTGTAEMLDSLGIGPGVSRGTWMLTRATAQARSYTLRELRLARFRILSVRERLVTSSQLDGAALVEAELMRIVGRRRGA